jgi:tRNA C32,U32 (ribose-2'-O)-methylase TrmJ
LPAAGKTLPPAKRRSQIKGSGKAGRGYGPVECFWGKEGRGEETQLCSRLVNIPTADEATSLNLAQAVLMVCYEIFKASKGLGDEVGQPSPSRPDLLPLSRRFTARHRHFVLGN